MNLPKVALAWSGGKDSMLALHTLREEGVEVSALLTTVTSDYDRISVHGVRRDLLERQARSVGVELEIAFIPPACPNAHYEASFGAALHRLRARGITTIAAGDLYLEDVRAYREALVARHGLQAAFPIWGRDTAQLAREFIALGFEAVLTCVDTHALAASFAGRAFDAHLLASLPATTDPCGENGEFHTFVHAGPQLAHPLPVTRGEIVLREARFCFCDLLLPPQTP